MTRVLQEPFDGAVDVSTERAVCRLLLGDMEGAEAALGLAAGSDGAAATDPEILQFAQVPLPRSVLQLFSWGKRMQW